MNNLRFNLVLIFLFFSPLSQAGKWGGEIGIENRIFVDEGVFGQKSFQASIRGELEYHFDMSAENQQASLLLFGRVDKEDEDRSHADIRELSWTYIGDAWEVKAGVSKEFWGVTESQHLVDILNQTDAVENLDGEDKLGQPMVKYSTEQAWGTVDLFLLPFFRERTFSGPDGRFVLPLEVETDEVGYESSAEHNRTDFAIRFSHYWDELEYAISHFSGTSREPLIGFNGDIADPKLVTFYPVIDQTGLELQYIYEDWIYKLEMFSRSGFGERYTSAVGGFEYTQVGIFDTRLDLGWIAEYLFDDRKENSNNPFEQDVFLGWRLALNDEDSSEVLAGFIVDPETDESVFSIEASQRIFNDWKIVVESRVFNGADKPENELLSILAALANPDPDAKTAFFQTEDFVQIELIKYF